MTDFKTVPQLLRIGAEACRTLAGAYVPQGIDRGPGTAPELLAAADQMETRADMIETVGQALEHATRSITTTGPVQ